MVLRIIISILLLAGFKFIYSSFYTVKNVTETPVDQAWWNGLSEEWKIIFIINQNFKKQHSDIFALHNEYINRMNATGEDDYSPSNKSLYDLNDLNRFALSYTDFYARALRRKFVFKNDSIDLATLKDLDSIYMVNGPGDLTPLRKFSKLKLLIINYCAVSNTVPINKQVLDLEPLRNLKQLTYLHCSSPALQSLEPIKDCTNLLHLNCDYSSVTSLAPLKNIVHLESLSFGSKVKEASVIAQLPNLRELYINGCKEIPDLSGLKKLKKLSVAENELAVVNANYSVSSIDFLKNSTSLEYVDLGHTSYKGNLTALKTLQQLKAITLPPVSNTVMLQFKQDHKDCIIINAFEYER